MSIKFFENKTVKLQNKKIFKDESGDPGGNRTCNCSLGGSRYIHLTTRPFLQNIQILMKSQTLSNYKWLQV